MNLQINFLVKHFCLKQEKIILIIYVKIIFMLLHSLNFLFYRKKRNL